MAAPADKPGDSRPGRFHLASLAPLRTLWPWIRPHRADVAKAFGAILLVVAALLMMGRGLAYLVDSGLGRGDTELLTRAVVIYVGITAMLAVGSYLRAVLISKVAERIIADIRKAAFHHAMGLSSAWFERNRTGDVIATLTVDTTLIQTVMALSLSRAARNALVLVGGVAMLVLTSPKLTLVLFAVIPVVVVPVIVIGGRLRVQSRRLQERLADVSAEAEEALTAITTVHAFSRGDYMEERFNRATESSFEAAVRRLVLQGVLSGMVILLVLSAIAFTLWMGGQDLLEGEIRAGELTSFVFYSALVASAVYALSDLVGELQRAAGAADRIAALLREPPAISSPADHEALPGGGLSLHFDRVSFHYESRPDKPMLDAVDLEIKPAERVALVGPSGAGKSTMLGLILRLFDPVEGRVLVGGVDARRLDVGDLREAIGLVPQETALFSGTIAENILFGRPGASRDEMIGAARAAHADEFVAALPEGYDTAIGEKGIRLSGGQRQRLAIARALLRDPRILLLDEATSSLDAQSEQAVQAGLATLMAGRTTVVVAHRLATVLGADRIIVMDGGRIAATGSHDELLASSPLYHDLASLQLVAGEGG